MWGRRLSPARWRCIWRRAILANRRCSCPPIPAHSLADMLEIAKSKSTKIGIFLRARIGLPGSRAKSPSGRSIATASSRNFLKAIAKAFSTLLRTARSSTAKKSLHCWIQRFPACQKLRGCSRLRDMLESGEHDHIVVDTAPFGHTLRLFELPGHFQRFLNFLEVASSRDDLLAQRFGGRASSPAHSFLEKWQATVRQVKEAFSAEQAEVLLVTSPETFSLNEAVRCVDALKESAAGDASGRRCPQSRNDGGREVPALPGPCASGKKGGAISKAKISARAQVDRPRSRKSSAGRAPIAALR